MERQKQNKIQVIRLQKWTENSLGFLCTILNLLLRVRSIWISISYDIE